jgi:hypothetical protein
MTRHERRIQNYLAAHPGATRSEARGHGATPEHPRAAEKQPEKYGDYLERRRGLEQRLINLKFQQFGSSTKFRSDRSARNARENTKGQPHSLKSLEKAIAYLDGSYEPDENIWGDDFDEDWHETLWYH